MDENKKEGTPWVTVDTDTFPKELNASYEEFLEAYRASKRAWKAFEAEAKKHVTELKAVPDGKVPAFNYNGNALLIGFKKPKTVRDKEQFSFQNGRAVEPQPSPPIKPQDIEPDVELSTEVCPSSEEAPIIYITTDDRDHEVRPKRPSIFAGKRSMFPGRPTRIEREGQE